MVMTGLAACSLEEHMNKSNRLNSFQTEIQCKAVLNGCYDNFNAFLTANFAMMAEAQTDLWYCDNNISDAMIDISPAKPGSGINTWTYCYRGVMRCNECVECIAASPVEESKKMPLVAEAKVLRALYYYFLTNTFDGVPFYTYMVEDLETLEKIRKLPRTPADEIRRELYKDLQSAIDIFETYDLDIKTSDDKENRARYALGLMLMAKFAMWSGETGWDEWNTGWDAALAALDKLEVLYGKLDKYPLSDTDWGKKNTPESIFEIQHAYSATGIQYTASLGRIYYPIIDGDGWFDGVYMPQYGTTLVNASCLRSNYHFACFRPAFSETGGIAEPDNSSTYNNTIFGELPLTYDIQDELDSLFYSPTYKKYRYRTKIALKELAEGKIRGKDIDRRIEWVLGLGDLNTGDTFNFTKEYGKTFGGKKFWCRDLVSNYDSNNYKLFRYADAVLMMAECHYRKGEMTKAESYLNETRNRAGIGDVEGLDDDNFITELLNERARELAGELHRKYDLVRILGKNGWCEITKKYHGGSKGLKDRIKPYHAYYPIPDTECALTGYILTNDAYEDNTETAE